MVKKTIPTFSGQSAGFFMDSTSSAAWYAQLAKPFFAPPASVFGPVWTVLYLVIAVSFGYVLLQTLKRRLPFSVLLPFILNLVFNLAYTPIQFGLKNNALASVDILLVLGTLVWAMVAVWRRVRWVALVNIPYLLWVAFATVLQLSITWMNR
ncbi:TspO and MBR related proteins [Polaromonas sp. YR568]|uniref:TspO/MBR family protein n=1 Tax=Polaromonas sp. YR568 TaxID=1855301 RepID=UPI0008F2C99B|nr:TspO and MBR related proteins [Polaromonas sp. YR568]